MSNAPNALWTSLDIIKMVGSNVKYFLKSLNLIRIKRNQGKSVVASSLWLERIGTQRRRYINKTDAKLLDKSFVRRRENNMKAKLIVSMALTLMLGSICVRADLLDKIAREEQANKPSLPVGAQTNSSITFVVQVPSFAIAFPNTMTLSQIDDVLRTRFGTNLTFTFFATNSQTHERVLFSGNSMPNSSELEQLFTWQRQHDSAVATQTSTSDSNSDIEERKAAALERQADALERQAAALENQTFAQERAADAAEDQAFQAEMMDDDIDFRLDTLQIQNSASSLFSPTLSTIPFAPIQQPAQPTFILVPGQVGPIIVPPKTPGQPQLITVPGLNGPVIVSP